jgi:hypothetical protein
MNFKENNVGIHQPNFFPWLGYFYKIYRSNNFVFLDDVQIELASQQALVNRTKVKSSSGAIWITCPVSTKLSVSKIIRDVVFSPNNDWREKIKKTLYFNYKKAKYFDESYYLIEELLTQKTNQLAIYNINIIKSICVHIGIETQFYLSSELNIKSNERNERLIEICKTLKSSHYLSGKGGLKYHNPLTFAESNINIVDLNYKPTFYNQLYGEFAEGLSIVDVLFNCGKENTYKLLEQSR